MGGITKEKFKNKILNEEWSINRYKGKTYINAGSLCVAQVTHCVADKLVDQHNLEVKQKEIKNKGVEP